MAAAMPTPPLLSPDSLLESELPLSVESLACGVELPPPSLGVWSLVLGLFWTWSFDCLPESLSSSFSPLALAMVLASLDDSVEALTVIEPAVRSRATSAVVVGSIRFSEKAAPIATSLPPALAAM